MAAKQLTFSTESRQRMLCGIDVLAQAVGVTLGPRGRNVMLETDYGGPRITKDGVTVAKDVRLEGKFENMGVQLMREVASRTSYKAGDGTTTATVLAHAIVREGAKLVAAGANPMDLKRGIDAAIAAVVAELRKQSQAVSSNDEIAHIGTISANGDAEIGRLIADAMRHVGTDGVITVEEAKSFDMELDVVEGMQFDRGYISPSFITDGKRMHVELHDPYILIHENKLTALKELLPLLDAVMETGKPFLIIAEGVEGEALATLVVNSLRGGLKVAAVKAPGWGVPGKALLQDLAIATGGHVICDDLGIKLENASIKLLGRAKRVVIEKHNTMIVEGAGSGAEIAARIKELKDQITETTTDYDREKLQERIAKLAGAVAVIRVGGVSEQEARERKDRVDNALNATRAAVEEGFVPGGGVALLRASPALASLPTANADQQYGVDIVRRAICWPARQIAANSGADDAVTVGTILKSESYAYGYDAREAAFGDLVAKGIVDPTKVVRTALQAAGSIAGLLITTEVMITDLYDRIEPAGHHHHENMDIDF